MITVKEEWKYGQLNQVIIKRKLAKINRKHDAWLITILWDQVFV